MEEKQDLDWSPAVTRRPDADLDAARVITEKRCILHTGRNPPKGIRQDVLAFGEQQWAAVQKAAENRGKKRNFENSLYFNVVRNLPERPGENDGYRSICYKNFTAISSNQTTVEVEADGRAASTRIPHLRSE